MSYRFLQEIIQIEVTFEIARDGASAEGVQMPIRRVPSYLYVIIQGQEAHYQNSSVEGKLNLPL